MDHWLVVRTERRDETGFLTPRTSTSTLADAGEPPPRLLDERGYEQVSLGEIAGCVGVVRTAVDNYYRDKLSLLVA